MAYGSYAGSFATGVTGVAVPSPDGAVGGVEYGSAITGTFRANGGGLVFTFWNNKTLTL